MTQTDEEKAREIGEYLRKKWFDSEYGDAIISDIAERALVALTAARAEADAELQAIKAWHDMAVAAAEHDAYEAGKAAGRAEGRRQGMEEAAKMAREYGDRFDTQVRRQTGVGDMGRIIAAAIEAKAKEK